jgi:hypothetical protein
VVKLDSKPVSKAKVAMGIHYPLITSRHAYLSILVCSIPYVIQNEDDILTTWNNHDHENLKFKLKMQS